MARFTDISYLELGKYMRALIRDPDLIAKVKSGEIDLKQELAEFMTPRGHSWEDIEIVPHFDEAKVVHIVFPFTGDVEESIAAITGGEDYRWPQHYDEDPSTVTAATAEGEEDCEGGEAEAAAGETLAEKRERLYHCRLGDYVMARCR